MRRYSIDYARVGMNAGEYIVEQDYISWNYILIGELNSRMVKLLNINTGKIGYARPSDIYLPDPPKGNMYLDFDQEEMQTGDKVCIRNGSIVLTIEHIHAKNMT